MLAPADRQRLLELMGVPQYALRGASHAAAPVDVAPASPPSSPPSKHTEPPAPASIPVAAPTARAPTEARASASRHRLGLVIGGPVPAGLHRDFLRVLGQPEAWSSSSTWPDYALLLGEVRNVPTSVITVSVPLPLGNARAKRAIWRQLRPLLAELRAR